MSVIEDKKLKWIMKVLFCAESGQGLPLSIWMVHVDGVCEAILEGLPECDRWGIISKGVGDICRPNPFWGGAEAIPTRSWRDHRGVMMATLKVSPPQHPCKPHCQQPAGRELCLP